MRGSPAIAERRSIDLRERAEADLRAIRDAMEGSSRFTSVSGVGEIAVGVSALAAAWIASRQPTDGAWLAVWAAEAVIAAALSLAFAARKARRSGGSLRSLPARRFALSLAPPLAAGAALTPLFLDARLLDALPALWLLLYGTGVVTGGAFSERIVPLTGIALMLAGVAALALPEPGRDAWMAIGFGGIHVAFGALLAWRHGG
ncbi:MAG TPA: hypothetical protein VFM44_00475 [Gemmatimonadota bacterium]|nr:hypothetical protein [Gemmatimonadota bacterium]